MKSAPSIALVLSLALGAFAAVAGYVTVTHVTAQQRIDEPTVDIAYDLLNPSGGMHTVTIGVTTNSGATYVVNATNFSGDVGAYVTAGTNKQVAWFAAGDFPHTTTSLARVRVTAIAIQDATNAMAFIPAGAFQMGTNNLEYEDQMPSAGPHHTVTLSAFWMDKYEVTSQQWHAVRTWALMHGYALHAGSGKGALHPVQLVSWYDCVKWCNARSEMQGLTPCYYSDAAQTMVYRSGDTDVANEWVKWSANGYRLPTEAEWEKAARGGAVGMRFPWVDANTITNARANYLGDPGGYPYDLGPAGNNPLFTPGGLPNTSPVGYFAANGYGLYDMAGNVYEWCWDWYDGSWYSNVGATQQDTCGPASGTLRVLRGGSWDYRAFLCRVASRNGDGPIGQWYGRGFRCVCR